MTAEKVEPDTFKLPHLKLEQDIETNLTELLKEYDSRFAQDETSIGTTPLTKMTIDTGTSEPVSQKPHPIAMKHYKWVKDEIKKLLTVKVIQWSQSSWSTPIIVVPKGDGRKHLVIDYPTLNEVTQIYLAHAKGRGYFLPIKWSKVLLNVGPTSRIPPYSLDEASIPKTAFTSLFGKYKYIKETFGLVQAPAYSQELLIGLLKDFSFAITYLDDIIIFSRTTEEYLSHIKQVFE